MHPYSLRTKLIIPVFVAVALVGGGAAIAGPHNYYARCAHGIYCTDGDCIPNRGSFGFYQTRWRQWPTDLRPELGKTRAKVDKLGGIPPFDPPPPKDEADVSGTLGERPAPAPTGETPPMLPLESQPDTETDAFRNDLPPLPDQEEPDEPQAFHRPGGWDREWHVQRPITRRPSRQTVNQPYLSRVGMYGAEGRVRQASVMLPLDWNDHQGRSAGRSSNPLRIVAGRFANAVVQSFAPLRRSPPRREEIRQPPPRRNPLRVN